MVREKTIYVPTWGMSFHFVCVAISISSPHNCLRLGKTHQLLVVLKRKEVPTPLPFLRISPGAAVKTTLPMMMKATAVAAMAVVVAVAWKEIPRTNDPKSRNVLQLMWKPPSLSRRGFE